MKHESPASIVFWLCLMVFGGLGAVHFLSRVLS